MQHTSKRRAAVLLLLLLSVGIWSYVAWHVYTRRAEIILYISDAANVMALPYRLARLSMADPDRELRIPIQDLDHEDIADTWGDPRSGERTHEGVDMFASRGTPVFSATNGYVVRAGTNRLGGNIVFVMSAGGVRYYYAHLDAMARGIEVGKEVTTDTVLGFVGNTGNAETTVPHLHFGMYKNGAQDPYDLLIAR